MNEITPRVIYQRNEYRVVLRRMDRNARDQDRVFDLEHLGHDSMGGEAWRQVFCVSVSSNEFQTKPFDRDMFLHELLTRISKNDLPQEEPIMSIDALLAANATTRGVVVNYWLAQGLCNTRNAAMEFLVAIRDAGAGDVDNQLVAEKLANLRNILGMNPPTVDQPDNPDPDIF